MTKRTLVLTIAMFWVSGAFAAFAPPSLFFEGIVLGPDAKPLADAVVQVSAAPKFGDPPIVARTGTDGTFRVQAMRGGAHSVRIEARGMVAHVIDGALPGKTLRVTLARGETIVGVVLSAGSRTPVAGVRVEARDEHARHDPEPGDPIAAATTDANGAFRLGGLAPGWYTIRASSRLGRTSRDRFLVEARVAGAPTRSLVLTLQPAGGIVGRVVDDANRAVESFWVTAASGGHNIGRLVTSETGRFTLEEVSPGTYSLEVTTAEQGRQMVTGVKVNTGVDTDVGRVRLSSGGSLNGRVLDATSAPVAEAHIELRGSRRQDFGTPENQETTTDADGVFQLRGLRPETVIVSARHPDFAEGRSAPVEIPAGGMAETSIVLARGGRIEGVIRRRRPGALPDVSINVQFRSPHAGTRPYVSPRPDGTFLIEHVPPGRVMVAVMEGGSTEGPTAALSQEVDVREGETARVDFVWREILLTGKVTRGGLPLANIRLTAHATASGGRRIQALTRDDGSYEMIVGDVGRLTISAESTTTGARFPGRLIDIADVEAQTVDIAYPAGGISGVVVDEGTGAPLAGARIAAMTTGPGATGGGSATSGDDGRFIIDLDPGEFFVRAEAKGYPANGSTITVGDSPAPDIRIPLTRGFSLRGRIVDSQGLPASGLSVTAHEETSGSRDSATSASDGSFALLALRAGKYSLAAGSPVAGFGMLSGVAAGATGVVLRLSPGGRIHVLAKTTDGAAAGGAFVGVRSVNGREDGFSLRGGRAGYDGSIEIESPAGLVEVVASSPGIFGSGQVTVTAGGIASLEITLTAPPPPAP